MHCSGIAHLPASLHSHNMVSFLDHFIWGFPKSSFYLHCRPTSCLDLPAQETILSGNFSILFESAHNETQEPLQFAVSHCHQLISGPKVYRCVRQFICSSAFQSCHCCLQLHNCSVQVRWLQPEMRSTCCHHCRVVWTHGVKLSRFSDACEPVLWCPGVCTCTSYGNMTSVWMPSTISV